MIFFSQNTLEMQFQVVSKIEHSFAKLARQFTEYEPDKKLLASPKSFGQFNETHH